MWLAYLAESSKQYPISLNLITYANLVKQYSKQRQFLALGQFILGEMRTPKMQNSLTSLQERVESNIPRFL